VTALPEVLGNVVEVVDVEVTLEIFGATENRYLLQRTYAEYIQVGHRKSYGHVHRRCRIIRGNAKCVVARSGGNLRGLAKRSRIRTDLVIAAPGI